MASLLTGQGFLFAILAVAALATGILTVANSNPLRAALFLVGNLFCIAGMYLLLNAYFLATVQVIVYAGAIMVLFLFVIMLLNLGAPDRSRDPIRWQVPVAIGAGLVLAGVFGVTIAASVGTPTPPSEIGANGVAMGTTQGIGKALYSPTQPWLFPFEVTSVLLLVAVIGSVVLARRAPLVGGGK